MASDHLTAGTTVPSELHIRIITPEEQLCARLTALESQVRSSDQEIGELQSRIAALEAAAGVQPVIVEARKRVVDDRPF